MQHRAPNSNTSGRRARGSRAALTKAPTRRRLRAFEAPGPAHARSRIRVSLQPATAGATARRLNSSTPTSADAAPPFQITGGACRSCEYILHAGAWPSIRRGAGGCAVTGRVARCCCAPASSMRTCPGATKFEAPLMSRQQIYNYSQLHFVEARLSFSRLSLGSVRCPRRFLLSDSRRQCSSQAVDSKECAWVATLIARRRQTKNAFQENSCAMTDDGRQIGLKIARRILSL